MSILLAKCLCKGTRTLAFHRFGIDALSTERKEKTGTAGNDPTEWKRTVIMNRDRQLYLLPTYIFGMVRDAARNVKKGKGSIQKDVASTVQCLEDQVWVTCNGDRLVVPEEPEVIEVGTRPSDELPPVYVEACGVRNPSTRARNVRYRVACSPGWQIEFSIIWDAAVVPRNQMEQVVSLGGTLTGIADGRAAGYGRFKLLNWEVFDDISAVA